MGLKHFIRWKKSWNYNMNDKRIKIDSENWLHKSGNIIISCHYTDKYDCAVEENEEDLILYISNENKTEDVSLKINKSSGVYFLEKSETVEPLLINSEKQSFDVIKEKSGCLLNEDSANNVFFYSNIADITKMFDDITGEYWEYRFSPVTLPFLFPQMYTFDDEDFMLALTFKDTPKNGIKDKFYIIDPTLKDCLKCSEDMEKFVCSETGNDKLSYFAKLVADEYLTNVIRHGLEEKFGVIGFNMKQKGEIISLTFWDKGGMWAPEDGEFYDVDPEDKETLLRPGGRGIKLIENICKTFFRHRYYGMNETSMILPREGIL